MDGSPSQDCLSSRTCREINRSSSAILSETSAKVAFLAVRHPERRRGNQLPLRVRASRAAAFPRGEAAVAKRHSERRAAESKNEGPGPANQPVRVAPKKSQSKRRGSRRYDEGELTF